jgi:hypothetical protein
MTLNFPMEIGSTRISIGVSFLRSGAEHPVSTDDMKRIESPTEMVALAGVNATIAWHDVGAAILGLRSHAMAAASTKTVINFDIDALERQ